MAVFILAFSQNVRVQAQKNPALWAVRFPLLFRTFPLFSRLLSYVFLVFWASLVRFLFRDSSKTYELVRNNVLKKLEGSVNICFTVYRKF